MLGYLKGELIGSNIYAVHPPEFKDKVKELRGKLSIETLETSSIPLLSKNGMQIPVESIIFHGNWNNESALIFISRNLCENSISEEKFHHVFDSNQALMAISDMNTGVFINVNKTFLTSLGYERSEIIGHNSKELNLFYNYDRRIELAEKVKLNSNIENEYVIIRTKDGKPIHCLFSISFIKIQANNYLLTSAINISPLKEAEEKLKRSLHQQTLLADISQNFLSLTNLSEKINHTLGLLGNETGVSRVYIFEDDVTGSKSSNTYEWCNVGISSQIHELQDIPYKNFPSWKKILDKNGKIFSTNIKNLPSDIVDILDRQEIKSILVFPLIVQNHFFGFIGFDECTGEKEWEHEEIDLLRTISGIISNSFERHIFQKQLLESEIRQKLAIENTEAGLWDWNMQTDDVFFNDFWCKMLGYEKDEIEPNVSTWEKLVHPDDMPKVMKDLNEHIDGKSDYYENTHRLLSKSGKWKWVIDKGKIIEFDADKKPKRAIGTHIDIDNQKKIEEELRNLNNTKDKFFSIIAHDLRGPISSMMQISEMVSDNHGLDEETFQKFLNSQKELSKSTFQLLENLLNWARYNSEQVYFNPKKIYLNAIIDENIINIKYSAKQKGISIITDYSEAFMAYADEDMVQLIIRNLLSNAIKFTGNDGVIRIELEKKVNVIKINIVDSGQGISEENINKIISENEFYSTYGTAKEKGTGLGLKLCKSYIEENNGTLKIESKLNIGSSFSFTLPIVKI